MIGKLLGHTQVQTAARYAHLARDTVKASAARIGDSIDRDLDAAESRSIRDPQIGMAFIRRSEDPKNPPVSKSEYR